MSHCGYIVSWQLNEERAMKQSIDLERGRDRMKGQERPRDRLNGACWEEIGQRKDSKERRGCVEMKDIVTTGRLEER